MIDNSSSLNTAASWVIRNKETRQVIIETFDSEVIRALNIQKYEAVSILEYLQEFNASIQQPPPSVR